MIMMNRVSLPQVDCSTCNGACCRHMRTPPHIVMHDGKKFKPHSGFFRDYSLLMKAPEEARQVLLRGLMAPLSERPDQSPCSWLDLDTGRCRWREHRPDVCRSYNVGSDPCRDARLEHGVDKPVIKSVQLSTLFQ